MTRALPQRRCACGGAPGPGGECAACRARRLAGAGASVRETPDRLGRAPEDPLAAEPTAASRSAARPAQADVDEALATAGRPLDLQTRRTMEARFGHDFSRVRIHDDARAAATAAGISAAAFTVGQDIAFGAGRYSPGTAEGRRLLAHELAHTVQQRGAHANGPPLAAGSALETNAAEAGRAVAGGRDVAHPLGASRLALARELIGNENLWVPEQLRGEDLEEFNRLFPMLRGRKPYPGRERDLARLEQLKAVASKRFEERRAAVAEAEAAIASIDRELAEDLPAAARAPARPAASARFAPGGFTDEHVYREYEEARKRLEHEYGPPKDPRRFDVRLAEARRKTPPTLLPQDFPRAVWDYGLANGLFAPREEGAVRATLEAPRRRKAAERTRLDKMRAAQRQEQEFRKFRSDLNLMFIQGALMGGPKAPPIVRVPYVSYGTAHTGVELYRGIQSGDPTRIVGATLPLAAGYGFHRIAGVGEPLPVPRRTSTARFAPEEVTPAQVRSLYRAEPDAVKKNLSDSFHQQVWEQHGGEGPAPLAFRTGRVMQVNESRWSTVGKLSEINRPEELAGAASRVGDPLATARTQPDPRARTVPADPAALARTQPDPRAPTVPAVDPRARTVPAVDPLARTAADPRGATAPAGQPPAAGPAAPQQTQVSAPPAPRPAPPPRGRRPATPVTPEAAVAAYRANPGAIHRSVSHEWHQQVWNMDRGPGAAPLAFRSGNVILVDVELWPSHLLSAIGLGMQPR